MGESSDGGYETVDSTVIEDEIMLESIIKMPQLFPWCNAKNAMMPSLLQHLPKQFYAYHEPFFGTGALFWQIHPQVSYLSDGNSELMCLFKSIKDNVSEFLDELDDLQDSEDVYYKLCAESPVRMNGPNAQIRRAARFLSIARNCYPGTYREDAMGCVNSPFLKSKNKQRFHSTDVINMHNVLNTVEVKLTHCSFEMVLETVLPGDFIYLDPPHCPLDTPLIESVSHDGFTGRDQLLLKKVMENLDDKGAYIMYTNNDTPEVRELFDDWTYHSIEVPKSSYHDDQLVTYTGRELIVKNY